MPSFFFRTTAFVACVLALAPSALGDVICPSDTHATRCVMCKESDLGQRWAKYTAEADKCDGVAGNKERTGCYCRSFSQLSFAWSKGLCCSEYAPMLAVTANLCNLDTYPEDQISDSNLQRAISEAKRVHQTIWHNNEGWDIPKASTFIQPHTGGSTASYEVTPAQKHSAPVVHVSYKSEESSSQKTQAEDRKPTVVKPQEKHEYAVVKPLEKQDYPKSLSQSKVEVHQSSSKTSPVELKKESGSKKSATSDTVHHHAKTVDKCQGEQSGCCETNRQKYQRSRTAHRSKMQKLSKRDGNTSLNPRVTSHNLSKRGGCGKAFNGVEYPLTVPDTVLKMYKML